MVAKCISIEASWQRHDRRMRANEAAARWAESLASWAIPDEILAAAPEDPWALPARDFGIGDGPVGTPSTALERKLLPAGGVVLDVGCGGGRASLALAPPAAAVIGVDPQPEMLAELKRAATARGVPVSTVQGRWPDVAPTVPAADVVVCHHVVYNVPDLVPFLRALTDHTRTAVVVELTSHHPQTVWREAWRHFWGLERPVGPQADDFVAVVQALGLSAEVWRRTRPPTDDPFADPARAVRTTRRRLCLPAARDREIAVFLAAHPLRWPRDVVTVHWSGP
jgi:2-polyprenyl-3-methyl-5-hydroxy-6-metoxy-1,4-benzoquinol methylase